MLHKLSPWTPFKFWPIRALKLDVERDQRVTMVRKVKSNCLPSLYKLAEFSRWALDTVSWFWSADTLFWQLSIDHNKDGLNAFFVAICSLLIQKPVENQVRFLCHLTARRRVGNQGPMGADSPQPHYKILFLLTNYHDQSTFCQKVFNGEIKSSLECICGDRQRELLFREVVLIKYTARLKIPTTWLQNWFTLPWKYDIITHSACSCSKLTWFAIHLVSSFSLLSDPRIMQSLYYPLVFQTEIKILQFCFEGQ